MEVDASIYANGKYLTSFPLASITFGELRSMPVKTDLLWYFKGPGIDGHYTLESDGRKITPRYLGQTGSIMMDNGDIIDFVAVKKGER